MFLFKNDMSGFYLSLNQGVTDIKEKYKRDAKQVLRIKAEDFRAQLETIPHEFTEIEIEIERKNSKAPKTKLASFYAAGNIIAKYYSSEALPTDNQLRSDIIKLLKIYEVLSYNEGLPTTPAEKENDDEKYGGIEELKKYRFHKRIERNIQLSKKAKTILGYRCKACGLSFEEAYGVLGRDFIEAHHLIAISQLTGDRVQLDVRRHFTVLCSNCHSMIHRLDDPSDIEQLKSLIRLKTNVPDKN